SVGRELARAESQSAGDVEGWTILIVIGLLLAVYRAPLLTFIPLATVFVAVTAALKILALGGQAGWAHPFRELSIFVTVVGYGAGVDYCVFLINRARESWQAGRPMRVATAAAVAKTGPALAASAATVICSVGMMALAQFGKLQQAGIALTLTLALVLLAALTLTPSLLRLFGRWSFWPYHRAVHGGAARGTRHGGRRFSGGWFAP